MNAPADSASAWARQSANAIRNRLGYVIERDHKPGRPVDTVFMCRGPAGDTIGGASGTGISKTGAVAICDRHAERVSGC